MSGGREPAKKETSRRHMMVSEKETERIRRFVCDQLRNQPDLSTLTLGTLKKRYLVLVGLESLSPEARNYMKQVVEEELLKMQEIEENGVEQETEKPHNKRKREKENDEEEESGIEDEDESTAKKSRRQRSSESEENEGHKTGSEGSAEEEKMESGSEDEEQEVEKSQPKKNGNRKRKREGTESPVEDVSESGESDSEGPKDIVIKKKNSTKNLQGRSSTSPGKKTPQSDEENETDTERKSETSDKIESSDDGEKKEKVPVKKENNQDSDSSSLTSLEDEQETGMKKKEDKKKKKTFKRDEKTSGPKDDHKQVVRLKRYISLCGVKRNYKKLLDGCHSVRSMVAVLKKDLEDLGVQGQPSIKKCRRVKKKREEAQEVAELDVNNIIPTPGRQTRRGASVRREGHDSLSSTYKRTLNSASDSDEENRAHKGNRRATDWTNLQGIISDDADSD